MAQSMKDQFKVDELEENIEELKELSEDVTPAIYLSVILCLIILAIFVLRVYIRWNVVCPSNLKCDDKTIIITGANTGIGKATALELAKRGGRVILAVRDRQKGEAVARNIIKKTKNPNVFAHHLNLASLTSIKDFVQEFLIKEKSLHVLINNAAYMGPKKSTDNGIERSFGVNHLGHFYLTWLLKDTLRKCAPSRIINVTSDAYLQGKLDLEDLSLSKGYDIYTAYSRSKLSNMLFNFECHRRYYADCVISMTVHPGAVSTELMRNWPGMTGQILRTMGRILFKDPPAGCQTIVYCVCKDGMRDQSGKMFCNCKSIKIKEKGRDKQLSKALWNKSLHLCGLDSEMDKDEEVVVPQKTNGQEVRSRETVNEKAADVKPSKIPQQPTKPTEALKKAPEPTKKPPPEPAKKPTEPVKKLPEPVKKPPETAKKPEQPKPVLQPEQVKKQPEVPPKPASKSVPEATE